MLQITSTISHTSPARTKVYCSVRCAVALLVASSFVSACSGSSDSNNAGVAAQNSQSPVGFPIADDTQDASSVNDTASDTDTDTDAGTGDSDQGDASNNTDDSTNSNDSSTGDVSQNITRIDFDITVPAYSSNSLRLEIELGETTLTAAWVGDEYWSASDTFPAGESLPLLITFFDKNGDIALASHTQELATRSNDFLLVTITADQFNAELYDNDNDGLNNLSESIAGTDPLHAELEDLTIADTFEPYDRLLSNRAFPTVSYWAELFENRIGSLPLLEQVDEDVPIVYDENNFQHTPGRRKLLTYNLDQTGTGSLYDFLSFGLLGDMTRLEHSADRTNNGTSLLLAGNYLWTNSSAGVGTESSYSFETTVLSETTRLQTATIDSVEWNYHSELISYTLTGELIEGTEHCSPLFGTVTIEQELRPTSLTTIVKNKDDQYWLVNVENAEEESLDRYYAQSLGGTFHCEPLGLPDPIQ